MQKGFGNVIKGITELQKRMEGIQAELLASVYTGESAQGLVTVEMTGQGALKSLVIDPTVLREDAETVASLVQVAVNRAFDAKEAAAKEKLSKVSGMLPFGIKLPGIG